MKNKGLKKKKLKKNVIRDDSDEEENVTSEVKKETQPEARAESNNLVLYLDLVFVSRIDIELSEL